MVTLPVRRLIQNSWLPLPGRKLKAVATQACHHVTVFQCGQPAHAGTGSETGMDRLSDRGLRLKARRKTGGSGNFSAR